MGWFQKKLLNCYHLLTINQLIEKCNEVTLCIAYIEYKKAFDMKHEAIFNTLRSTGINETYNTILEDTYTGAAARERMDNQLSEEIPILRGVRQEDQLSPKLITATIQDVFKMAS